MELIWAAFQYGETGHWQYKRTHADTRITKRDRVSCAAAVGRVEAIHIALAASVPMEARTQIEAIAGSGLAGDRYAEKIGFYSPRPTDPGAREVTLFEAEVLDALKAEHGIELSAGEHRRNLTVRGVRLPELV